MGNRARWSRRLGNRGNTFELFYVLGRDCSFVISTTRCAYTAISVRPNHSSGCWGIECRKRKKTRCNRRGACRAPSLPSSPRSHEFVFTGNKASFVGDPLAACGLAFWRRERFCTLTRVCGFRRGRRRRLRRPEIAAASCPRRWWRFRRRRLPPWPAFKP